jgi:predicted amidophosphoribosyltransferase
MIVTPMPMPWQRRLYRGINHAEVIAEALAAVIGAPLVRLLQRSNGPPQVSLRASMRARARGSMRIRRSARHLRLGGLSVILVDDVRTSGSSLLAAARLLRRLEPNQLLGAVIAASDAQGRGVPPP